MSRNIQQQLRPTRFSELKSLRNSTAQNTNAETDKFCRDSKNMHIHHCSSEDRHSADVQVGSSRQIQELYRGNYQLKVESGYSSYVAAQPKIQTQSVQEPMADNSKHMNVDSQKIGSFQQTVEAQDGVVSNTFRVNRIDTLIQTNIVGTVSNRHYIKIDYCPAPVREFTGRHKDLEELKKMFEHHQVIAVVGMGGVGKSQLARKYGEQYKNTYQYRFWMEADTTEKLDSSFQELADRLDVKAISKSVLVNDIYQAFTKGPALLIFDNVIKPEHVYEYLPTRFQLIGVTVNVLITSICTDWTTIREVSMVLQPFEAKISLDLLKNLIGNASVQTDKESWMELANAMGHLPLALRLSSSFIRKQQKYNSKFTIQDYINDFNTRVDKLLTKTTPDYGTDRSIYVTTKMTLESLGKNSKRLVNAAAYFNPDNIINSELVPLIPKAYDLAIALADVINYSIFHDEGTDRFSMHRLIQTSIQLYQQEGKKDEKYYASTLEYALINSFSKQYDSVFAHANRYTNIIVRNYKKKPHRHLIIKYLLRNRCTDALKVIFKNFKDDIDKYDAIFIEVGLQCPDMFVFILSYVTSTSHKQDLLVKIFQRAFEVDNKSSVQFMLENKFISVTELYDDKRTLLHLAAAYASSSIISLILELNKDVIDMQDTTGDTALHTVIELCNRKPKSQIIKTVRILIDNGASVVIRNGAGCTALHCATLYKSIELVSFISQSDNTVVNIVDNNGRTALHRLCKHYPDRSEERVIDIARLLINNGASVVLRDKDGCTALDYATSRSVELVSLISQSDNTVVNIVDNNGRTALHRLCLHYSDRYEERDIDIFEILVIYTARVLIENGASVILRDRVGRTALHSAASYALAQTVSLLIQSNQEVIDIVDNRRNTALHLVASNYREKNIDWVEQTISILIENGLSIHTLNSDGRSPMDTIPSECKPLLRRLADKHEKSTLGNNGTK